MGITFSSLIYILNDYSIDFRVCGVGTFDRDKKHISTMYPPTKPIYCKNTPRSFTSKQMRRDHRIKQPGYDVQRKR